MSLASNRVARSSGSRAGRRRVSGLAAAAGLAVVWLCGLHGCANRGMESSDDAGDLTGGSGGAAGHATGGQAGAAAGRGGAAGARASGGTGGGAAGAGGMAGAGGTAGGGASGTGDSGRAGAGGMASGGSAGSLGGAGGTGGRAGGPATGGGGASGGPGGAAGGRGTAGMGGAGGGHAGTAGGAGVGGAAGAGGRAAGGAGGQAGPCAGLCANPVVFTALMYQSGDLGTNATCHQTTTDLNGLVCGNFVAPRHLTVNGTTITCTGTGMTGLPAAVNGGYCIQTTAGNYSFAYFGTF